MPIRRWRLHSLLVQLVCQEGLPFRVVESSAFKAFIAELDPRYKLPTRQALSAQLIPKKYEETKSDIKQSLALPRLPQTCGHLPATTPSWALLRTGWMATLWSITNASPSSQRLAVTLLTLYRPSCRPCSLTGTWRDELVSF